jgi:hypothetical protein
MKGYKLELILGANRHINLIKLFFFKSKPLGNGQKSFSSQLTILIDYL